jgi:hypothetical protein
MNPAVRGDDPDPVDSVLVALHHVDLSLRTERDALGVNQSDLGRDA